MISLFSWLQCMRDYVFCIPWPCIIIFNYIQQHIFNINTWHLFYEIKYHKTQPWIVWLTSLSFKRGSTNRTGSLSGHVDCLFRFSKNFSESWPSLLPFHRWQWEYSCCRLPLWKNQRVHHIFENFGVWKIQRNPQVTPKYWRSRWNCFRVKQ